MNNSSVGLIFVFFLLLLGACKLETRVSSFKDYSSWMKEEQERFAQTKSVNGVKVTVKYLPPEYNAWRDMEENSLHKLIEYDSLLSYYKSSASFIMTLEPDQEKGYEGDIMYRDLKDFKEYVQRSKDMNFAMEQMVELEVRDNIYTPVLSSLDNTYSLTDGRSINLVFAPLTDKNELTNAKAYQFIYNDELFKLGSLYFYFDKEKIENVTPVVDLKNKK